MGGRVINPVIGFEKMLFLADSKRDVLTTLNSILSFVGDERRIAFYFINADVLEGATPRILPLLEEIATTVIRITKNGRDYKFIIVKSINNEIDGVEMKI